MFLREDGDRSADRARVIMQSVFDEETLSPVRSWKAPGGPLHETAREADAPRTELARKTHRPHSGIDYFQAHLTGLDAEPKRSR